jgi:CheY-like chemotaxis protein
LTKSLELQRTGHAHRDRRVQLLIADADPGPRSFVASQVRDVVDEILVLEARDGAEAIRIGAQRQPQLALLEVNMPGLDGVGAAVTLRQLQPDMRVALHTVDPRAHRQRARDYDLPLFDKLDVDRIVHWIDVQARALSDSRGSRVSRSFECSACGYGIAGVARPDRCPMCRRPRTWVESIRWQPATGAGAGR